MRVTVTSNTYNLTSVCRSYSLLATFFTGLTSLPFSLMSCSQFCCMLDFFFSLFHLCSSDFASFIYTTVSLPFFISLLQLLISSHLFSPVLLLCVFFSLFMLRSLFCCKSGFSPQTFFFRFCLCIFFIYFDLSLSIYML